MDDRRYISGRLSVTALVVLFILSCAKINSPSGGPKDLEAPVILKSQPENSTVMFTGKSFAVTFDEFVVLDKITEKFMVSPPLKTKPEVRLKGKSLVVSWEDTLADSTTYTFYFQDAIRDNNENNAIQNFQYVFSTGPVLDSLSLSGNVFGAYDLEVVPDVLVMMYSNLSDTAPRTLLPAYISKPDVSGGFLIINIKPGRFRLYALKDINGNKMYDLEDEVFAFCDSIINITPEEYYNIIPDTIKYKPVNAPEKTKEDIFTFGVHRLYAFTREAKKQYLMYTERKSSGSIGFGLAIPSDTGQVSIELTGIAPDTWYMENNARRDTFMLWITSPEVYDREVIDALLTYPFTDSTGTVIEKTDSVIFRFRKPEAPRAGARKIPTLSLATNLSGKIKPGAIPAFTGPAPLKEPDTSKIRLMQIVDTIKTELHAVHV
ncbi:MAG: Ig-like domain-containing protein, partial [Bacteroidales bacterium]